jgi:hypothetical protein
MMRPQRIGGGADHELILGLLGAKVVLDDLRALLAWAAAAGEASEPATNASDLVDVLLGVAALASSLERWPAEPDVYDRHDAVEPQPPDVCERPSATGPRGSADLLR